MIPRWAHDIISGIDYPATKSPAVGGVATWDGKRYGPQINSGGGTENTRSGVKDDKDLPPRAGQSVIWDHVEAKLALRLRHLSAPKHVVLFLDRPPCPSPDGCQEHFAHLLPKDKTVTIFIAPRDGGGVRPWGRFTGTGRYLKE